METSNLNLKEKKTTYDELCAINRFTEWDDIKVGDQYHIPPLWIYERRDLIVETKTDTFIHVKILNENNKSTSIFKGELSARFLIKKQNIW